MEQKASTAAGSYNQRLSKRAEQVLNKGISAFARIREEEKDAYHPDSNPMGKINMGTAENRVCQDMVWAKLVDIAIQPEPQSTLTYGQYHGHDSFLQSVQRFLTRQFSPLEPIHYNDLFVMHGMTPTIEALALALCDAGDYMMVFSPYYYRAKPDIWDRACVDIVSVPILLPSPNDDSFVFDLRDDLLEECYQQAKRQGKTIRAINFTNPTNPSGNVFTPTHIKTLLDFAHRHNIHVIANEIYALTTFDPEVKFTSVLSVPWPDPGRVHFVWACSKDFGVSGYRCSILFTRNTRLQEYSRRTAIFSQTEELVQLRMKALLDDEDWIDNMWLPTLRQRLNQRYEGVCAKLTPIGVTIPKASGSLFAWMDLRKWLPTPTEEGETWLLEQFFAGGVLMIPGMATGAPVSGFFRVVVTLSASHHEEGVRRIISVLSKLPH